MKFKKFFNYVTNVLQTFLKMSGLKNMTNKKDHFVAY